MGIISRQLSQVWLKNSTSWGRPVAAKSAGSLDAYPLWAASAGELCGPPRTRKTTATAAASPAEARMMRRIGMRFMASSSLCMSTSGEHDDDYAKDAESRAQ